jgi:hypothetical protein
VGEHCLGLNEAGAPCQRRSEGGEELHGARSEDVIGLESPTGRRRRDQDWILSLIVSHQPLTYIFPDVRRGQIRDAGDE